MAELCSRIKPALAMIFFGSGLKPLLALFSNLWLKPEVNSNLGDCFYE